jgi:chromosome segregation ATPase
MTIRPSAATVVALTASLILVGGCSWKQERDQLRVEKQQLTQEKDKIAEQLQSTQAADTEANTTLDEVEKSLDDLRSQELKVIRSSITAAQEGKPSAGRRERLQTEMDTIRRSIHENLEKLARLEKQNKQRGVRVASLEKLSNELKLQLQEKDTTLAELEKRITGLNQQVEDQTATINEKDTALTSAHEEIDQRTKEAHTAYIAVASKDVLKQKGIVQRKGDVLGVGGRWLETGKFDPEVFREVDVTKETQLEIPAPAKNVRVISEQPAGTYRIVDGGPTAKASKLEVTDPDAFWKGERYLVVMLK